MIQLGEAQTALGLSRDTFTPAELIRAILCSPVDLLWNGGIGTYVKSSDETNADIGDRANDSLRVDGKDLRAKVVGEGGNLGFSQRGRVEYALRGGRLTTPAAQAPGVAGCGVIGPSGKTDPRSTHPPWRSIPSTEP